MRWALTEGNEGYGVGAGWGFVRFEYLSDTHL